MSLLWKGTWLGIDATRDSPVGHKHDTQIPWYKIKEGRCFSFHCLVEQVLSRDEGLSTHVTESSSAYVLHPLAERNKKRNQEERRKKRTRAKEKTEEIEKNVKTLTAYLTDGTLRELVYGAVTPYLVLERPQRYVR